MYKSLTSHTWFIPSSIPSHQQSFFSNSTNNNYTKPPLPETLEITHMRCFRDYWTRIPTIPCHWLFNKMFMGAVVQQNLEAHTFFSLWHLCTNGTQICSPHPFPSLLKSDTTYHSLANESSKWPLNYCSNCLRALWEKAIVERTVGSQTKTWLHFRIVLLCWLVYGMKPSFLICWENSSLIWNGN